MSAILYWLTLTATDIPQSLDWLSIKECNILDGLRFAKRRTEWLLGRWTAKQAVCACLNKAKDPLSALEIFTAEDGAPEAFWNGAPAGATVSISHSNARSFCAVGPPGISMGCDLERIEAREERFITDYFTAEEVALCTGVPAEEALAANLIWSAKESVLKAVRQGMRRDTRSVRVYPNFRESEGVWKTWTGRCLESSRTFCGWWGAWDGFVYTFAADRFLEPSSL